RARRGNLRAGKGSPSPSSSPNPLPLFSEMSEIAPVLDSRPAEVATLRDESTAPAEKSRSTLTSSLLVERRIWSVRALVTDIRQHVETNYTDLWVEGEISNCRHAPS